MSALNRLFLSVVLLLTLSASAFAAGEYTLVCRSLSRHELAQVTVFKKAHPEQDKAAASLKMFHSSRLRGRPWILVDDYVGMIAVGSQPRIEAPGRPVPPLYGYFISQSRKISMHASFEPLVARLKWSACRADAAYAAQLDGREFTCDWVTPPCQRQVQY